MNSKEIGKILEDHKKWVYGEEDGKIADLQYADLRYTNLRNAVLPYAYLRDAALQGADLRGADLRDADLQGADLRDADLLGADLRGTHLCGADLEGAKNVPFIPMVCPDSGEFIAWKKCRNYIVKLKVLDDAKRSSATGRKCRCDKALVLEIQDTAGYKVGLTKIRSDYDASFIYRVGEIVQVNNFNEDRFLECASGIHFFINRQEAVDYRG